MPLEHAAVDGSPRRTPLCSRLGLALGPLLALALIALPLPLEPVAQRMAAVGLLVVTWWITEALPLPVTALVGPSLAALLGIAAPREVFAPFGDPVILLFLGSFLMAEALHAHGLDRRLALAILSLPGVTSSPWRVLGALSLVTAGTSMWISNTATAAMMLPIALGLARSMSSVGRAPTALLLTVAYSASIGGVATPVGTPPNLIGLGFLERVGGISLDFATFMAIGVPLSLTLLAINAVVLRRLLPGASAVVPDVAALRAERRALAPWGAGEWACATVFASVVTLWVLPGVAGLFLPASSALLPALKLCDESVVALLGAALLFAWPIGGGRRALAWEHGAGIDWGTLLLFGGGLSMGKLFFDTGLAEVLGRAGVQVTGVSSLWGLTALALATATLLTELTSNTAAVNMLAPLVAALAQDLGVPLAPPLLAVSLGASMAFMLPVSTPPNAIVYGTGLVPLPTMMRLGIVLDVATYVAILAWLRLMCPLLGLA
jgi:sodium-dependent dicarboxylate transporter 2/3/5